MSTDAMSAEEAENAEAAEAVLIAEISRRTQAALADPIVRLGSVHKIEEVPKGPGGRPYITLACTWAEPATGDDPANDDPGAPPEISALILYVHPSLLDKLHRELAGVHPCTQLTDHPADGNSH
jgi:hypothetical protein